MGKTTVVFGADSAHLEHMLLHLEETVGEIVLEKSDVIVSTFGEILHSEDDALREFLDAFIEQMANPRIRADFLRLADVHFPGIRLRALVTPMSPAERNRIKGTEKGTYHTSTIPMLFHFIKRRPISFVQAMTGERIVNLATVMKAADHVLLRAKSRKIMPFYFPEDSIIVWCFHCLLEDKLSVEEAVDLYKKDWRSIAADNPVIQSGDDLVESISSICPQAPDVQAQLQNMVDNITLTNRADQAQAFWGDLRILRKKYRVAVHEDPSSKDAVDKALKRITSGDKDASPDSLKLSIFLSPHIDLIKAQELLSFYGKPQFYPRATEFDLLFCSMLRTRSLEDSQLAQKYADKISGRYNLAENFKSYIAAPRV